MLDRWLEKEFRDELKKPHINKILFFDAAKEYERVIPWFRSEFKDAKVLIFEGSLLKLKYQVEMENEGKKCILYLPIPKDEADYIKEYEFVSYIFEKLLYTYLKKKGARFPSEKEEEEAIKSALPLLAERSIEKSKSFWENLSKEKLADLLFPDFYQTALELIASPQAKYNALQEDGIEKLFFAKAKKEFGVEMCKPIDTWVETLLARVFLTEAFVNLGEPQGYPFMTFVASSKDERERLINFLKYWMNNSPYKEMFKKKAGEIEGKYNLGHWAKKIPLEPQRAFGFLGLAKNAWEAFCEGVETALTKDDFVKYMESHRELIEEKCSSFWCEEGEVPGWQICLQSQKILEETSTIKRELGSANTAKKIIEKYGQTWWRLDKYYRDFKKSLTETSISLDAIVTWTEKIYGEAVEEMNRRFSETLEVLHNWELGVDRQRDFWKEIVEKNEKKLAIFFVDALRYELGKNLAEMLGKNHKVSIKHVTAEIPTETPVGMAMLLPHDSGGPAIILKNGSLAVSEGKNGFIIIEKKDRKAWLEKHFSDVNFAELDELNKPSFKRGKGRLLVVFSVELDALGTALGATALNLYEDLLKKLKQGINKIFDLGAEEVCIVTDHGFLMLEEIKDFEKIDIKGRNIITKSERYIIGSGLEAGNHLKFVLNEDEGLEILFPRGIYCFKAPGRYDFLHGGVSLQEVVIPLLVVEKRFKASKVSARIELSGELREGIRNQIFKVNLVPEAKDLFATEPRTVRVFCEKEGNTVSNEAVEVVKDEEVAVTLRIDPSANLDFGDEVTLKAIDDETFELLDETKLNVYLVFDIEV